MATKAITPESLIEKYSPRGLLQRGYDRQDGVVSFKGVPLWPAEVLDPPSADDPADVRGLRKALVATLAPFYQTAFQNWFEKAFRWGGTAALAQLDSNEKKALSEGADVAGGFLVPADFVGKMLQRMAAVSVVRSRATVIPTARDALEIPAFAPHGSAPSTYSSGFVGDWSGETALLSDTDPAIEKVSVPVKKLRVGTKVSWDMAADVGGVDWLLTEGAKNLAAAEDGAFLNGDGVGKPVGILPSLTASQLTDVEGSTVNTISNTTAADGSANKVLTFAGSLPSQYQRDAVLVLDAATEASINKLVDANRNFLFPRRRGPDGRRELLGNPVENSPHVPLQGTDGNRVLLLGAFEGYLIAQRALLSVVLTERFADSSQIGLILFDRVGGAVWNLDAFRGGVV